MSVVFHAVVQNMTHYEGCSITAWLESGSYHCACIVAALVCASLLCVMDLLVRIQAHLLVPIYHQYVWSDTHSVVCRLVSEQHTLTVMTPRILTSLLSLMVSILALST